MSEQSSNVNDFMRPWPSLDIARDFIVALTGKPNSLMRLRFLKKGAPSHEQAGTIDALWPEVERLQAEGYQVYYFLNEVKLGPGAGYGGTANDDDVTGIRTFATDHDNGIPDLWHLQRKPSIIVETSPGRGQALWPLTTLAPVAVFNPGQRQLATFYGSDPSASNPSRVFRLPGTLHLKGNPHLVTFRLPYGEPHFWTPAEVFDGLPPAPKASPRATDFDWDKAQKDVFDPFSFGEAHERLSNIKYLTDRSKGTFRFMKLCVRRGYTPEQTVSTMLEHGAALLMDHYGSPPDEERVRADVIRAFTKKDRPQREKSSEEIFRACQPETAGAQPIRVIQIYGGDLPVVINEAEAALIEQGADIFQRGSMLVRPSWERIECADGRTDTAIRLVPLKLPSMRDQFTAAAVFQRYSKTSDAWYAVDCPPDVAATYLEREGLWKLRRLAGVINCPTLRPDGTLLDRAGYDAATGLLYLPNGVDFPTVPEAPTRDDALAALALLKNLIETFPFTSEASRSVALSAMLTALVRRALPTAPLHAFTAPVAGSGKSMLVNLASLLATGSLAAVSAQGRTEEETEKRLASHLIAGSQVVSLDNCTEPLAGDFLCQVITQQRVSIRILGLTKNVEVPPNAFMAATGNNLTVAGDMTRRALMCALDPEMERPELRNFPTDPEAILRKDRGRYVAAGLTILRAYITFSSAERRCPEGNVVAGRQQPGKPLASFGEWCRLVRDPLTWLREADACDTIESIRAGDPEREQLAALIYHWHKVIGGRPVTAKEVISAAYSSPADPAGDGQDNEEARTDGAGLLDALMAVSASFVKGPTAIDPKRLGTYLGKHAGRVLNGHTIVREGQPKEGKQFWRLK